MRHSFLVDLKRSSVMLPAPQGRVRVHSVRRLPSDCFQQARTLEARALPSIFLAALVGLVAVQLWLALAS